MTRKELQALIAKSKVTMPYYEKSIERDAFLFKWRSNTEGFKVPYEPEILLTMEGGLGYDKVRDQWVVGTPTGLFDKLGDFQSFVVRTLDNTDMKGYTAKNHDEVIMCGNTPLFRSFEAERQFYSTMKGEVDKSIYSQLINSRLNKAILADSDNKKKQVEKAYEAVKLGFPMIIVTSLLEGLETIDLTDPSEIEKMQYLSSFYQTMEKREANDIGVDLENIDKKAQVTSEEIRQYNDITTMEYLVMWEMRQAFVEEMKENGYDIEIVRNPVYFDEPTKEDVEEGTFEAAEVQEETPAPEENTEEGGEEDGNTD